jgi:hypothetical protein
VVCVARNGFSEAVGKKELRPAKNNEDKKN